MQLCVDDAHGHLNFKLKLPNNNNNYKHEYRKQASACSLTICRQFNKKKTESCEIIERDTNEKKIAAYIHIYPQIEFHTLLLTIYVKTWLRKQCTWYVHCQVGWHIFNVDVA